jgi:hypothetical protein
VLFRVLTAGAVFAAGGVRLAVACVAGCFGAVVLRGVAGRETEGPLVSLTTGGFVTAGFGAAGSGTGSGTGAGSGSGTGVVSVGSVTGSGAGAGWVSDGGSGGSSNPRA